MTAVYHDFDQAGLDAEYNLRAAVPDHGTYFARWARDSALVRGERPCRLDLAYGGGARHRLDVFPTVSGAPLLLFLHGGYWQAMDKSDFSMIAPGFLDAGIAVALANYTLAPVGSIDEMVAESSAAFDWLVVHAEEFGFDPGRIAVCGHSAGGQLAMMTALSGNAWRGRVGLACAISGVFDLDPVRLSYLNRILGLDAASAERNSPLQYVGVADDITACRIMLSVGGRETGEFRRQQTAFAEACGRRGTVPEIVEQPEDHHFSIIDRLADANSPLHRRLVDAISRL